MKDSGLMGKFWSGFCFLAISLLICTLIYTFRYNQGLREFDFNPMNQETLQKPITLLAVGCDQEYKLTSAGYRIKVPNSGRGRTDTIIIFKFDPQNSTMSALNIPRDTKIFINGKRAGKINQLNTLGGPFLLKRVLENLLKIQIDNYILIDIAGIQKIVDQAGGIELRVPKRMVYRDQTDDLNIRLEPGKQVLNGRETIGFLRFRHDFFTRSS